MSYLSFASRYFLRLDGELQSRKRRRIAVGGLRKYRPPYKVHFGCGSVHLNGWINSDLDHPEIPLDVSRKLPLPDSSCSHIFHEHLMEHLPLPVSQSFLRECRRILAPGGRMRIAMPDVEDAVEQYLSPDWHMADWLQRGDYTVATRCEALNACFRWWDHQWLYDFEELKRHVHSAGFTQVQRVEWGRSKDPALSGLESRAESKLVCEAW